MGGQRLGETVEVAFGGAHHIERVDAQRVGKTLPNRQQAHGVEIVGLDGRQHDLRHARGPGARDDGVTVDVELGRVEVAVAVDPHAAGCISVQRKTTVRLPFSSTRCSACHWMARARATHSMSRPMPTSCSGVQLWSMRATSCSMMGPSSRSLVT